MIKLKKILMEDFNYRKYLSEGELLKEDNPKPQEVIDAWKKATSSSELKRFCTRDNCGPAALDIMSFAKDKYGIELDSPFANKTQGFFRADRVVSGKRDFTTQMKKEFKNDGGNWNDDKERESWIENSKYSEGWKYIPHYWLVDEKGNIYDPVGQEQFIDAKYAKDLDKNRYVEEEPEIK